MDGRPAGRSRRITIKEAPIPRQIGWREWLALPDLGVEAIKAKIDTGARSSALHAFGLRQYTVDGEPWVSFEIHPQQRSRAGAVKVRCPVEGWRRIRSSDGKQQDRPYIITSIQLAGEVWPIELTLTKRDEMGFRMLVGRRAVRRRFLVNPGRSYLGGRTL
ncbi:MAG: RimK/LysX family protein [Actinomycetota bacterium]